MTLFFRYSRHFVDGRSKALKAPLSTCDNRLLRVREACLHVPSYKAEEVSHYVERDITCFDRLYCSRDRGADISQRGTHLFLF